MSDTVKRALAASMTMRRAAAKGGRLSTNVEDRRDMQRWDKKALDSIDDYHGVIRGGWPSYADGMREKPVFSDRSDPTPSNNGIDDLFTRTPRYHTAPNSNPLAQEQMWRDLDWRDTINKAKTTTPGGRFQAPIESATPKEPLVNDGATPDYESMGPAFDADAISHKDFMNAALDAANRMQRASGGRMNEVNSYLDSYHVEDTPEARQRLKDLSKQNYYNGAQSMSPDQRYQLDRLTRSYNVTPEIGGLQDSLQSWDDWAGERMNRLQHGFGEHLATGNFASGGKVQRILDSLGFYSKGREVAAQAPQKMSPEAFEKFMVGRGVKANELKHADWQGQTKGIRSLSPSDAADLLQSSAPKIQEKVYGGDTLNDPHYESYTLGDDGQKNYTERVLHLPRGAVGDEDYIAPHFNGGPPNILGHIRTVDRNLPGDLPLFGVKGPGKTLHIEEAQSDWGQTGRREGWRSSDEDIAAHNTAERALLDRVHELEQTKAEVQNRLMREAGIPDRAVINQILYSDNADGYYQASQNWHKDMQDHVLSHPDFLAVQGQHNDVLRQMRNLPNISEDGPPWHPLVADTNAWNDLAIKRALKVAAEGKYNSLAVSPGDVQFDRWGEEGLRDIYDNKFVPSLQSSLRKIDKAAGQRSIHGIGDEWHVTKNGDREDEYGDMIARHNRERDAMRDADRRNDWERDDYENRNGEHDPDHDDFDGAYYDVEHDHKANLPTFNMTDEAAEKINREGFPYFADGGAVDMGDQPFFNLMRPPESITGQPAYGRGHPERTIGSEDDPLFDDYASRTPDSVTDQSRYAGDKLLGAGRELPGGETYLSEAPSGLGRAASVVPNLGNYFKRQGEAAREGVDTFKQGWGAMKNGDVVPGLAGMGAGAMGYVMSPVTGAERVMVRDPYLNATGNLKDANAAESATDFAIFGGIRGALPHGMMKNPSTAFQTERAAPRMAPAAAAAGAGAVGMTANSDDAQAIVPPDIARALKVVKQAGQNPLARDIARSQPGAHLSDEDMLHLMLQRYQKPHQAGDFSPRGGVFYLSQGDQNARHYSGNSSWMGGEPMYGGKQKITGETAFANPFFVRAATGGSAPEKAYAALRGKSELEALHHDVSGAAMNNLPGYAKQDRIQDFIERYAPDVAESIDASHVMGTSSRGNQMKYALQEAAIGQALRDAGHDALLSYNHRRSWKWGDHPSEPVWRKGDPFVNEVFDVREDRYPTKEGGYSVHDKLKGDK